MKFYIDFDHTLYNTNELISDLINETARYILENGNFEDFSVNFKSVFPNLELITVKKDLASITQVLKDNFKRPEQTYLKIDYNIYALVDTFSKLFSCNFAEMKNNINSIISNGEKYLYSDSLPFLNNLKKHGHQVHILSHEKYDLSFQKQKIQGSGVFKPNLIDGLILAKISKASIDKKALKKPDITFTASTDILKPAPTEVDYNHGIFIDDRPKDLEALYDICYKYENAPFKIRIYRIKRPNQTYSTVAFSCESKYKSGIKTVSNFEELSRILTIE